MDCEGCGVFVSIPDLLELKEEIGGLPAKTSKGKLTAIVLCKACYYKRKGEGLRECGTCYYFHRDDQLPKSYGDCHYGDMIFGIHEHKRVCKHYKKWVFPKEVDEE